MDQTQLLDWHEESDPEDPSGAGDAGESPKPVGRLHLLSSKYGPEKDFWIYLGKNVIGRLESCQICLPASSISKAHAVIEVPSPDGPHLLYDQESLNRTRRQRMVLLPHVRYSLQDGDTLLFGDVGCQYFILDPEGGTESPNDSLEVPPTQARMDANALVIEETPVPGRKMGFGCLLVQDSDKEEEGEEVVNGAGKMLHLPVDDGSDSSLKHNARGHCSVASSMFSSPSPTIVPESDEESGEPSESSLPCPSLRLCYENEEAELRSVANGSVTHLNQETHPLQPGSTEAKVSPDSSGQPVVKDQDAAADPSLTDFHLDSDTDMEDDDGVGTTSERPSMDSIALELGSDTDAEEPTVTPLNQETHPIQPGNTEMKVSPDSRGQPVVKDQDATTDPSLTNFYLDSDTDREDEDGVGTTSERPSVKDSLTLELGSDTDTEEPTVVNPSVGSVDNGQLANDIDSDTDIEEAEENPSVLSSKAHRVTNNRDNDIDVKGAADNAGVESSGDRESSLHCKDSRKGKERADGNPEGHRPHKVDRDTDVEAAENPGTGSKTQPPLENEDDTDVEELSLGAENREGALKDPEASRDSDTDVEVTEPERLCGASPHSPQPTRNEDSGGAVMELKGTGLQQKGHLVEGAREIKDASVEPPEGYGVAGEQSRCLDGKEPAAGTQIVEQPGSMPQNQHLLAISVDSDTDVEEAPESPKVSSKENCAVTDCGPGGGNGGDGSGDLEAGPREEDSDTDLEVASPSPKTLVAHDSDTDVEAETLALPRKPLEEQDTQLVSMRPSVDREEEASSAAGLRACHGPCKEDEDTDVEGNESCPGDESNTDEEDDSDLALQATQCYLPIKTSSSKAEKARDTTAAGSRCALEEEATQAFVFRSPSSFPPGKTCSSPLKDDDPDIYMLEATQPFCKGSATLSEEPTQAFIVEEEEDIELVGQQPLERERLSEQATQPAVPISAIRGQDSGTPEGATELRATEVSCPEPVSQPADGAAAEEPHKEEEIQPLPSAQVPPTVDSQPLALPGVEKASGSEEQTCVASPEGGVTVEPSQPQGGAGCIESGPKERRSKLAGDARDAEQLPQCATDEPSKPVALVSERRRSLRSSTASSPSPLPEGSSSRHGGRGRSAAPASSSEPAAVPARRRGLRQLSNPMQYMGEPKRKVEEPKAEKASPGKTPGKGEPASQGRLRRSQRNSASKPEEETAIAASSLGTKEPTRSRKRRAAAATTESMEERQLKHHRTRSSRQSRGASEMTTLSPKDSGKDTKAGQESAVFTPSSGRRLRRQSLESKPTGTTRSRSHSSAASATPAPKVLFTGVIDEEGEQVVTELGGSLAESVFDCTHLVTDRVRRTVKFLCALARGIPIVTLDWLEKSKRNSFFLAPNTFLVHDPEQEKNFQFSLTQSLKKARQKGGLLQGYELHVTPNVKPEPEHMRDIIKCSGGTFLPRMPRTYKDKRVIISCPEDLPRCKAAQDAGVPLANSEFILTGILQQKADLDAHRLDREDSPSLASPATFTTRAGKRRATVLTAPAPPSTAKRRR
ncbi:mediator of DNA damage checkpoint protein 1 [Heteronotia binoei]|uniref:mediator of DNA damage checkpoint protein 1 n=1 Tax=Heteronotia binoei TaxID=13085 RepID=UPI002931F012|nr:mediator of DNA damage checkpoint protein 1 [Heteronotia binoei]